MGLPKIQGEVARLWKAPELKFLPSGKAVCELPLVFNKRKQDADGTWQDAGSMFVRASVWDKAAEHCGEALDKGDDVIVTGELSVREFERKDGSKGQSVELRVYEIGASLKWNGVKIVRAERGSSVSSKPSDDPWSSAPSAPQQFADDEPPF
jgi:single-strand DNA-binding protein